MPSALRMSRMLKYIGYAFLTIALLTLVVWLVSVFVQPILPANLNNSLVFFFFVLSAVLGSLAAFKDVIELVQMIFGRRNQKTSDSRSTAKPALFSSDCGDRGIDLAHERYLLSSAFGTYFTGLLESESNYINLKGQIDLSTAVVQNELEPLQAIFWELQRPRGAQAVIIAADGGMGKSTLAAKIIKCLRNENAIDMILGDSAKTEEVNPTTGAVVPLDPAYYSPETFFERLCTQLGLPYKPGKTKHARALEQIQDRLEGRRALIVADNLESVTRGTELFNAIRKLATRDTRVIVTTRDIGGLLDSAGNILVVHLSPIKDWEDAKEFVQWHIRVHVKEHPDLIKLEHDIEDRSRILRLVERTGGIPLLIQLVISDIARSSWKVIDLLPNVFGKELLDFLYRERWKELGGLGQEGSLTKKLLLFVSNEQYKGHKLTFGRIEKWAEGIASPASIQTTLHLLQERFLIVNHDPKEGNFAVFPSLAYFLKQQGSGNES